MREQDSGSGTALCDVVINLARLLSGVIIGTWIVPRHGQVDAYCDSLSAIPSFVLWS